MMPVRSPLAFPLLCLLSFACAKHVEVPRDRSACESPALSAEQLSSATEPRPIKTERLIYPDSMVLRSFGGRLVYECLVCRDGHIYECAKLSGESWEDEDRHIIDQLMHWRFEPARAGEVPVPAKYRVAFELARPEWR